jgi:hypothetical protein
LAGKEGVVNVVSELDKFPEKPMGRCYSKLKFARSIFGRVSLEGGWLEIDADEAALAVLALDVAKAQAAIDVGYGGGFVFRTAADPGAQP